MEDRETKNDHEDAVYKQRSTDIEFRRIQDRILKLETENLKSITELQTRQLIILSNLEKLVTRTEFTPIKLIVYGLTVGILSTSLHELLNKVFK